MKFIWSEALWAALLLPCLVVAYAWLLSRRKKLLLGYPSLGLVRQALGGPGSWRRHVPPLLLLLALAASVLAAARPAAVISLPSQQSTIVLVMDVSGSMKADDVAPNRLTASQVAAKGFAESLPRDVRVGVVAYGGTAHLVQPPTLNRQDVVAAIDRFQLQRATAIGNGLAVALATLFPQAGIDVSALEVFSRKPEWRKPAGPDASAADPRLEPVPPGSYESAAIVLLTDGQNTTGADPLEVAQLAADLGVKVFTVGFGSKEGAQIDFGGWSMRVRLDEDTLKTIASFTRGQYFQARSGADLSNVYSALKSRLVFEKKETEITVFFAIAAGVLSLLASALSVWWYGRVA